MKRPFRSLLVLLLVNTAGVLFAQQKTQPPQTATDFQQSSVADLIQSLKLHKPDPNNPVEREIDAVARALPLGDVIIPGVWICNGCGGATSHPDLGIVIDTQQLGEIVTASAVDNPHILRVFVVAHEAAHQVQYVKYGRGLLSLPEEDRRYYEAQADILAAIWLYQDAGILPLAQAQDTHSISQALHAVYNLGVEQYALSSHPSREARAFAARSGFQIGLSRRPFFGDAFQNAANSAAILRQLGVKPGESDLDFSLRLARRITLFNSAEALDLVLVESNDAVVWDKSADNPQLTYHLTYANRGTKALHVSLEALCLAVSRKDVDDFFQTLQVSSKFHEIDIPAGGQTTVSGQLRWLATSDRSPQFRYPPDDLGLLEVHYADHSDLSTSAPNATLTRFNLESAQEGPPVDAHGYELAFSDFLQSALHGYIGARKGIGTFDPDLGDTEYASNIAIPGAIESKVSFVSAASSLTGITSTLLRTTDAASATALFNRTAGLVRAALKDPAMSLTGGEWSEYASEDKESGGRSIAFRLSPYTVRVKLKSVHEGGGQGNVPIVYFYVRLEWQGLRRPVPAAEPVP